MAEKYYEIVEQSKYHIQLNKVNNIEDCGDEFITTTELEEMGLTVYGGGTKLFTKKITSALQRLKRQLKKSGKKSIKIEDKELLAIFAPGEEGIGNYSWSGSRRFCDFVEGARKTGDKISFPDRKGPIAQTVVKYADWKILVTAIRLGIDFHYGVDIKINLAESERVNLIKCLTKILTWKEVEEYLDDKNTRISCDDDQRVWVKKLYEDPELAPLIKTKS